MGIRTKGSWLAEG